MKDPLGHGSNGRGGGKRLAKPIPGHPYHQKSDAELRYIAKDAGEAAQAMRGHSPDAENKYLDQVNDAASVMAYRRNGGKQDLGPAAAQALASGDKSAPVPAHGGTIGRHGYNPDAINEAIASNNRHGPKIGGREAKLIHRLMRGR